MMKYMQTLIRMITSASVTMLEMISGVLLAMISAKRSSGERTAESRSGSAVTSAKASERKAAVFSGSKECTST